MDIGKDESIYFRDAVLSDYTQEHENYVRTLKITYSRAKLEPDGFQVGCRADVVDQVLELNSQINVYYDCKTVQPSFYPTPRYLAFFIINRYLCKNFLVSKLMISFSSHDPSFSVSSANNYIGKSYVE